MTVEGGSDAIMLSIRPLATTANAMVQSAQLVRAAAASMGNNPRNVNVSIRAALTGGDAWL